MIKFNSDELFDLNKIGLWVTLLIALLLLNYPIKLAYLLGLELLMFSYGYYLFDRIKRNKNVTIIISKQDKWFVEADGKMIPIHLRDFWLLKQYIFFWAKGAENSVSFVVTRSIIGAQKFSQLRALIK